MCAFSVANDHKQQSITYDISNNNEASDSKLADFKEVLNVMFKE